MRKTIMATERQIREEITALRQRNEYFKAKRDRGERFSAEEQREILESSQRGSALLLEAQEAREAREATERAAASMGGIPSGPDALRRPKGELRGVAHEQIKAGQSVRDWFNKAAKSGEIKHNGTDRDVEQYWQERMGFKSATAESRALGEGTTSGAGAGAAVVPDVWSAEFVDLLRANLVLSDATILPMSSVRYHLPVFASDVAPAYVAENASMSLDGNPGFAPLIFDASGAYQDVTLLSRQVVEDAASQGGLTELIQGTIAKKYARLIENVALFGNSAVSSLVPGLAGETGVQHFAAEATLADYDDFSKAVEKVRNVNSEPTGIITNPAVAGTFERLKAATYAKYWQAPASVAPLWPPRISTVMPATETAGAAAETGGALSSAFVGDFSKVVLGMRIELQIDVLRERYADQGQIGILSYMRFCPRVVHPETFVRVTDIATS
jgi:HK97 family phage major capsid protein